jgi:hypothetical protein
MDRVHIYTSARPRFSLGRTDLLTHHDRLTPYQLVQGHLSRHSVSARRFQRQRLVSTHLVLRDGHTF